ncbi:MAG: hypothetical protein LQ343_000003 [Gyalolechia ehrenbergii]|nr:MAG: hypothetical protein LQ343_000003 [Gyalolechia ehrenbergii]
MTAQFDNDDQPFLAPPAVAALRQNNTTSRAPMQRTDSMNIRDEREDLKQAAEQSLNVILDLSLDGIIRWASPSWKDVVGSSADKIKGTPIKDLLLSNKDAFSDAVESMKQDDSRSQIVRFHVRRGISSSLEAKNDRGRSQSLDAIEAQEDAAETEDFISLEGQGIMVHDRTSAGESHTMWMIRPAPKPREITIDLPDLLIESLGVGAEMLAHYLTALADVGANDPENHPPPLPVLCRICERQITPWWFEKHSEVCLQEYRAEMGVQMAQEALSDHRNTIVKVLDALEAQKRRPVSGDLASVPPPQPEYKGFPIGPSSNSSPASESGRASPSISSSRDPSATRQGHVRSRSFAVRRPLSRIVELILDLCDTALEINTPAIRDVKGQDGADCRAQSPQSESRISQILSWQTPSSHTMEQEQGLAVLSADTENVARAKVDAILRHRGIIEYSERIRVETSALVADCIDAAMRKAASIAAGQLSDSSSSSGTEEEEETPAAEEPPTRDDAYFVRSYDGQPAMASALRHTSASSLSAGLERRPTSRAPSSRSSSPLECPTPRSNMTNIAFLNRSQSVSKRSSMYMGSDAGESDSNLSTSVVGEGRQTESPSSLARSSSTSEYKRRSLKLPSVPSPHRQSSPARSMQPSSPLNLSKPRIPLHQNSVPSPITSPSLSTTEHSSPVIHSQRHRRQSSAASSSIDLSKPPPSPRLASLSHPQARAVPTSIKDFEIIKPISKGAFGSVYLSKKKSTGDYFAIKVLKKADMVAKNQVTNVKAERAIMMWQGESDFVAKLYWTFSSKDYLYLVMEYLNGGDCASLVKVLGGLPEDWAKKYLAEVVLGVEHLHTRGIVHRDLKPDNLLIDQKGHLKLTDFGLSRMGLIGRQKRHLKSPKESTPPDILKYGPFARATSIASSRSASFDLQGNHSPSSTPIMTPDLAGSIGQPSYFSLNKDNTLGRQHSRRKSGYRSDSGNSDTFSVMFRNFSLNDEPAQRGAPIEEETHSEGGGSPDPYILQPSVSNTSGVSTHNPPQSGMLPPPMALFDPEDQNRRFVGTPDYLAPETINGLGQDEMSDWWSLGCILFEFLFGYPPYHADTPEKVFENILARRIDWPDEEEMSAVSTEAKDLMERLMTVNPKERLGANMQEKFASGGEEIRKHVWFSSIKWQSLLEDEAQFIPAPENPEDTEYFDTRGATLQAFAEEMEDQASSPAATPGAEYPERPHDALSRVRNQVNAMKRGLMPLHIPAHVRDGRSRRLSEPVATDDFGNFAFKNLPVLEKANKDVLQKLRAEAAQKPSKAALPSQSSSTMSQSPSLEGSPLLPMPLKRALSANRGHNRPASPSGLSQANASPNRASQPSSPLLVQFTAGQNHERRKTSSTSSTLSHQSSSSLQPGNFFDVPKLPNTYSNTYSNTPTTSSPIKAGRLSMGPPTASPDKAPGFPRPHSIPSARARSQTVGSQEGDLPPAKPFSHHHKRRSQVIDISPSSSDNEDPRAKALLRVQRRRQSSRRMSHLMMGEGPVFRPLDVLVCEDHPVSRMVMERLLEKLKCRTISVVNGPEAARYAMSEVQFDIILMEFKLPQINGADVARMIRDTKSANTQTPIICVTGYLKELPQTHHFDSLIEKPPTVKKLTEALCNLCRWKPPPPGYSSQQMPPSGLRQESHHAEDSPSSQSSGPFTQSLVYRNSRQHSIGSSFFGDTDSTNTEDVPVIVGGSKAHEWQEVSGLGITSPTDDVSSTAQDQPYLHPGLPHLIHLNSAPPDFDLRTPRKQRSVEAIKAKRENIEKNRHECAESGDDEDEELGHHLQSRARSPHTRTPRGSKLSTEMLRTNSRGSVTSECGSLVPLHNGNEDGAAVPPTEPPILETGIEGEGNATIEPPEIFEKKASGGTAIVVDMDVDATPRPVGVAHGGKSGQGMEPKSPSLR